MFLLKTALTRSSAQRRVCWYTKWYTASFAASHKSRLVPEILRRESSSGFTAHLMDPKREQAFFTAHHQGLKLSFGYSWQRSDFPWLGIWEENRSRKNPPWNGRTITRGMEFGASPMPESRRRMIGRGTLFGVPTYRWLPARSRIEARYSAAFTSL